MDRIVRPAAGSRKRIVGDAAEEIAARFLQKQGFTIVSRNYRVRGGEIDLICETGKTVVFVEVRLRHNPHFGGAAESITPRKRQRIILAARHWLLANGERDCRFDCVLMDGLDEASVNWIENAFSVE